VVGANPAPTSDQLAQYLQDHELNVSSVQSTEYNQIAYTFNNQVVMLTGDSYNHVAPASDGPHVVWEGIINGAGQIFFYDVITGSLTQLTSTGSNIAPAVNSGHAVWQTWDGHRWQVAYYDGFGVSQITSGNHSSIRPSLRGQQIIYAEQLDNDSWQAMAYDVASGTSSVIASGDTASTAYPHFNSDGSVDTGFRPY
jgi:Tol biopolymer transport system component